MLIESTKKEGTPSRPVHTREQPPVSAPQATYTEKEFVLPVDTWKYNSCHQKQQMQERLCHGEGDAETGRKTGSSPGLLSWAARAFWKTGHSKGFSPLSPGSLPVQLLLAMTGSPLHRDPQNSLPPRPGSDISVPEHLSLCLQLLLIRSLADSPCSCVCLQLQESCLNARDSLTLS